MITNKKVASSLNMEIDDKLAYQVHGILSSESDSDSDGKDVFDEEYYLQRPPPEDYESVRDRIVVIKTSHVDQGEVPICDVSTTKEEAISKVFDPESNLCLNKNVNMKKELPMQFPKMNEINCSLEDSHKSSRNKKEFESLKIIFCSSNNNFHSITTKKNKKTNVKNREKSITEKSEFHSIFEELPTNKDLNKIDSNQRCQKVVPVSSIENYKIGILPVDAGCKDENKIFNITEYQTRIYSFEDHIVANRKYSNTSAVNKRINQEKKLEKLLAEQKNICTTDLRLEINTSKGSDNRGPAVDMKPKTRKKKEFHKVDILPSAASTNFDIQYTTFFNTGNAPVIEIIKCNSNEAASLVKGKYNNAASASKRNNRKKKKFKKLLKEQKIAPTSNYQLEMNTVNNTISEKKCRAVKRKFKTKKKHWNVDILSIDFPIEYDGNDIFLNDNEDTFFNIDEYQARVEDIILYYKKYNDTPTGEKRINRSKKKLNKLLAEQKIQNRTKYQLQIDTDHPIAEKKIQLVHREIKTKKKKEKKVQLLVYPSNVFPCDHKLKQNIVQHIEKREEVYMKELINEQLYDSYKAVKENKKNVPQNNVNPNKKKTKEPKQKNTKRKKIKSCINGQYPVGFDVKKIRNFIVPKHYATIDNDTGEMHESFNTFRQGTACINNITSLHAFTEEQLLRPPYKNKLNVCETSWIPTENNEVMGDWHNELHMRSNSIEYTHLDNTKNSSTLVVKQRVNLEKEKPALLLAEQRMQLVTGYQSKCDSLNIILGEEIPTSKRNKKKNKKTKISNADKSVGVL